MRARGWNWGVLSVVVAGVLITSVIAGCGSSQDPQTKTEFEDSNPLPAEPLQLECTGVHGGRFVYVTIGDPKTFNPTIANESSSTDITSGPTFSGILEYNNGTQEIEPGLAKSWEKSEDGLRWTFHFREGVRWSDGHPFSVDDVIFTSTVVYDTDVQASIRAILMVEGVPWKFTAVDSLTLQVDLPGPFGPVLEVIGSMYLVPKHILEGPYKEGRYEQMWGIETDPSEIVCLGPFKFKNVRTGEAVVLERNPHYWKIDADGKRLPYLDELVFVPVTDYNATMLRFQNGDSHMLDPVRPEDVALIEDEAEEGGYTTYNLGPDVATNFIWFNMNSGSDDAGTPYVTPYKLKWFDNNMFRRAVSHSLDRDGMVQAVLQGRGNPQYEPMTIANKKWYYPDMPRFKYDPDKARAMFDELGMIDRDGDGIREDSDGNKVEFLLYTNSENTVRKGLGTVAMDNLEAVGVSCLLSPLEFNTIISHIRSDRKYEAILLGLTGGVPPDPALSRNVWLSSGVTHQWDPEQETPHREWEAEIDRLMYAVVKETDYEKRREAFNKVQHIVGEQQPMIYLARENLVVAVNNNFKNIRPSVLRPHVMWNIYEISYQPGGRLASR
jgi:peptide/nickel transport system substrate-binding protein